MTRNTAARRDDMAEIDEPRNNVSHDAFWHGTVWPIPAIALAALVDMGLCDKQIAHYFRVEPAVVLSLRMRYGIREQRL